MDEKKYIAIDLKSFYASVECIDRGLDPMDVNLVVADPSRTEKTICLAVSPALKSFGVPGRPRLFEVNEIVRELNGTRRYKAPGRKFTQKSVYASEINSDPAVEIDFLVAPPRMSKYMQISNTIYGIYLKYIAPEDIHVYSVDEVFIDATDYLETYKMSAKELAMTMIKDVLSETGITATAGIGTNLYLCKIAMDIDAKHAQPDENGVRMSELDETEYRRRLWDHRPLTDFWRIGRGYASKLEGMGLYTMGEIARFSLYRADRLYKAFGINAELLIDHAWGVETAEMKDIKSYRSENNSISQGQVLQQPYSFDKAELVIREMTDMLVLDLVEKRIVTDQMVLTVGYDIDNLKKGSSFEGNIETDRYGRKVPKQAHGSINLSGFTSSSKLIIKAVSELFERIVDKNLLVRRMYIVANHVKYEAEAKSEPDFEQMNLFTDYEALEKQRAEEKNMLAKERKQQEAIISIKRRYGKNAILKGMNLEEGATAVERNKQVGGHKA